MGEFLEQYGGIVVGVIVATALAALLFFANDGGIETINEAMPTISRELQGEEINETIEEAAPELEVYESITLECGKEFDPSSAVISAYDSNELLFNDISGDSAKNVTSIKKSLVPGKVNIVYPANFDTSQEGEYTLVFYVKNPTSDGRWTSKKCVVLVNVYDEE